jgi:hypothetical protein
MAHFGGVGLLMPKQKKFQKKRCAQKLVRPKLVPKEPILLNGDNRLTVRTLNSQSFYFKALLQGPRLFILQDLIGRELGLFIFQAIWWRHLLNEIEIKSSTATKPVPKFGLWFGCPGGQEKGQVAFTRGQSDIRTSNVTATWMLSNTS